MLGSPVLDGSSALITLVGSEVAEVEPELSVAVTTSRIVEPIMLVSRPTVVLVAPEISLHEPPEESHSSHCREKLKGSEPDHPPPAPVNAARASTDGGGAESGGEGRAVLEEAGDGRRTGVRGQQAADEARGFRGRRRGAGGVGGRDDHAQGRADVAGDQPEGGGKGTRDFFAVLTGGVAELPEVAEAERFRSRPSAREDRQQAAVPEQAGDARQFQVRGQQPADQVAGG